MRFEPRRQSEFSLNCDGSSKVSPLASSRHAHSTLLKYGLKRINEPFRDLSKTL